MDLMSSLREWSVLQWCVYTTQKHSCLCVHVTTQLKVYRVRNASHAAPVTEAGMGSMLNSTGLPPTLLLILTTSTVTDTLSPEATGLGILMVSCRSWVVSTAVVEPEDVELKGSARAVVYFGPTTLPPSCHALPYTTTC